MTFFRYFPNIAYDVVGNGNSKVTRNIFRRVAVLDNVKDLLAIYDKYSVNAGETPEIVADIVYGSAFYHWVILLVNDIKNPYYEWPMEYSEFERFVTEKYGDYGKYDVHHYEDADGNTVLSTAIGATSITNYEYETLVNEEKRLIRVLKPEYLGRFVENFKKII